MKILRKLSFWILFFCPFLSSAQTLLPSSLPNAGDFIFEFIDNTPDTTLIQITPPGLNQTWDYWTSINVQDSSGQFFANPSQIPFQFSAFFPNAEFGVFSYSDSTAYALSSTSNGFYMDGIIDLSANSPFDSISFIGGQCLMPAPLSIGSSVNHQFNFHYPTQYDSTLDAFLSLHRTTFQFFEPDATGTFNGPAGSYANCIRVKQTRVSIDTIYVDFANPLFPDTMVAGSPTDTQMVYSWVRNATPFLVAEFAVSPTTNRVFSAKVFNGSGILTTLKNTEEKNFTAFPNPASNSLTIQSPGEAGSLVMYDLCGKLITQQSVMAGTNQISLENIPSGYYQMMLISNKGEVFRNKLQVIK